MWSLRTSGPVEKNMRELDLDKDRRQGKGVRSRFSSLGRSHSYLEMRTFSLFPSHRSCTHQCECPQTTPNQQRLHSPGALIFGTLHYYLHIQQRPICFGWSDLVSTRR